MAKVTYVVVQHDGGWAYKFDGVFSETFPTHDDARAAARRAALEQQRPGETSAISWEDQGGKRHEEKSGDGNRTGASDDARCQVIARLRMDDEVVRIGPERTGSLDRARIVRDRLRDERGEPCEHE